MAKTTITEALAALKTAQSRIEKKQAAVLQYLGRDARLRDPMEKEGGSAEFVRRERQAIADLQAQIVKTRVAIQAANLATSLTVEGETRTLAEWLTWRRECSEKQSAFLDRLTGTLAVLRQQAAQRGQAVKADGDQNAVPGDVIVSLSEAKLAEDVERHTTVLGVLDGKLSLLNATTMIDV